MGRRVEIDDGDSRELDEAAALRVRTWIAQRAVAESAQWTPALEKRHHARLAKARTDTERLRVFEQLIEEPRATDRYEELLARKSAARQQLDRMARGERPGE